MLELSPYAFYELPQRERRKLVGKRFRENGGIYFPLDLAYGEFNYGIRQGLIIVTEVRENRFKVGVVSPDDLDLDLEFEHPYTNIRWDVITFIEKMNKVNVTYRHVLLTINDHFHNVGQIW